MTHLAMEYCCKDMLTETALPTWQARLEAPKRPLAPKEAPYAEMVKSHGKIKGVNTRLYNGFEVKESVIMGAVKLQEEIRDREVAKQERFQKQAQQRAHERANDMHAVLRRVGSEAGGFKRVEPTITKQESNDPNGFLLQMFCASKNDVRLRTPGTKLERPASARTMRPVGKDCHPMAAIEQAYYAEEDRRNRKKQRPSSAPSSRKGSLAPSTGSGKRVLYQGTGTKTATGRPASAKVYLAQSLREDARANYVPPASPESSGPDWSDPRLTAKDIVRAMIKMGDSHSQNKALTVSEMRSYLKDTAFAEIVEFLERNDLKDYKMYDQNHDGELDESELFSAVAIFLERKQAGHETESQATSSGRSSVRNSRPQSASDRIRQMSSSYQSRVPNPFVDHAKTLWREQQKAQKVKETVVVAKEGEAEEAVDDMADFDARLRDEGVDIGDDSDEDFDVVIEDDDQENVGPVGPRVSVVHNPPRVAWDGSSESRYSESESSTPKSAAKQKFDGRQLNNSMLPPAQYEMSAGTVVEVPSLTNSPRGF